MSSLPPTRDNEVTLHGRGGLRLVLFAPREGADGTLEADIVYAPQPIRKGRIFQSSTHKYRLPAIPGPAFHVAHLVLTRHR